MKNAPTFLTEMIHLTGRNPEGKAALPHSDRTTPLE